MFNIKKRVVKYLEDKIAKDFVDAFNDMSPHLRNVYTNKYIEDEVGAIEYLKLIENLRGRHPQLDSESAAEFFVQEGYAEKYNKIWYEGITECELRNKLFYSPTA